MWWTELVFRKHVFAEPAVSLETIFGPVTSCQLLDDDQRGGPDPDWKPLFGVSDEFADLETMAGHDDLLRAVKQTILSRQHGQVRTSPSAAVAKFSDRSISSMLCASVGLSSTSRPARPASAQIRRPG